MSLQRREGALHRSLSLSHTDGCPIMKGVQAARSENVMPLLQQSAWKHGVGKHHHLAKPGYLQPPHLGGRLWSD